MSGAAFRITGSFLLVTFCLTSWAAAFALRDPAQLNQPAWFQLLESNASRVRVRCTPEGGDLAASQNQIRTLIAAPGREFRLKAVDYTIAVSNHTGPGERIHRGDADDPWKSGGFEEACLVARSSQWHDLSLVAVSVNCRLSNRQAGGRPSFDLKELEFSIEFSPGPPVDPAYRQALVRPRPSGGYEEIFASTVLNPESVPAFRRNPGLSFSDTNYVPEALGKSCSTGMSARIRIDREGIHAIQLKEFASAGALSWDPSRVRLFTEGRAVPFQTDGTWTPESRIFFWGMPGPDPDLAERVYYLTETAAQQASLEIPPARAEAIVAESTSSWPYEYRQGQRKVFVDNELSFAVGRWYWFQLNKDETEFTVDLPALAADPESATVFLTISGRTDLRQEARIDLTLDAEHSLQAVRLERRADFETQLSIPAEWLGASEHKLAFRVGDSLQHSDGGGVYIESLHWRYRRRLDLSAGQMTFDPKGLDSSANPIIANPTPEMRLWGRNADGSRIWDLSGWLKPEGNSNRIRFAEIALPAECSRICLFTPDQAFSPESVEPFQSSRLHETLDSVDYLIVSHRKFILSVEPLAAWRRQEGWSVRVIDVQSIYDEFSHGHYSARAIRDYFTFALANFPPPLPQFALLVGDSSYDPENNLEEAQGGFLPYASYNRRISYLDPADEWFVRILGDDALSDLIIGRLSVANEADCHTAVEKIIRFERHPLWGPWRARALMLTDNHFEDRCQSILDDALPEPFERTHLQIRNYPMSTNQRFKAQGKLEKLAIEARRSLVAELNRGSAFTTYFGHGGGCVLAHEAWFLGLDREDTDVLKMANRRRLPFVPILSCLTGLFNYPRGGYHYCLSEELIRRPEQGAIAVLGPSGKGGAQDHEVMTRALKSCLFGNEMVRLGAAVTAAEGLFVLSRQSAHITEQFNYFGDPLSLSPVAHPAGDLAPSSSVVNSLQGGIIELRGQGFPFAEGRGLIRIHGPASNLVATLPVHLESHSFSAAWACPPGIASGTYSAVAYCWNAERGRDALAQCEIAVERPQLDLQWKSSIWDDARAEAVLTVTLENRSNRFPVKAEARLLSNGEEAQGEPVELNPAEKRDLAFRIEPETGARLKFEARLADEYPLVGQSRQDAQPILCEILPQSSTSGPAKYLTVDRFSDSQRVAVCLLASEGFSPDRFEAGILSATEPLIALKDAGAFAAKSDWIQIPFPVQPLQPDASPATLIVSISGKASSGMPVEASWSVECSPAPEYDLALNHVEALDPSPVEGFTDFFLVDIQNRGEGNVQPGSLSMSTEGKGEMALPLRNRFNIQPPDLPSELEPGQIVRALYRWDLYDSMGAWMTAARIESSPKTPDFNPSNNRIEFAVDIRSIRDYQEQLGRIRKTQEGASRETILRSYRKRLIEWEYRTSYELYDENYFKLIELQRLALYALASERMDLAEPAIEKAASLAPDERGSMYLLANLRFRQNRFDEGVEALRFAHRENILEVRNDISWDIGADPRLHRAGDFSRSRWWRQAEDLYYLILDQQPANLQALIGLAEMYLRFELQQKAVEVCQQAARLVELDYSLLPERWFVTIGRAYAELGKNRESMELFDLGQQYHPEADFTLWKSQPRMNLKQWDDVWNDLQAIQPRIQGTKDEFYWWALMARYQEHRENTDRAIEAYRRALLLEPLHRPSRRRLLELRTIS